MEDLNKSTILIISAVFPPEPVVSASLSKDIAMELSKKNKVVILCPIPTRPQGFPFSKITGHKDYKVVRLNSFTCAKSNLIGRLYESYSFGKHCQNYINKHAREIKCIYINSWPLLSQYLVIKSAKKFNIPCVIHIQDIYPESLVNKIPFGKKIALKLLLPIDKYSLRNAKHILCISENMKEILQSTRKISAQKFTVISNWQNEEKFISYRNLKCMPELNLKKAFTFMYLGNNGPLAGVDFLIKSFIKADIPNTKFIIAGVGSRTDACKKLASDLNADNIEFLPVPEGKVAEVQDMADVMLLPVKKNGAMSSIPSKLPAYMFSAKPIIGSLDLESDTAKAIIKSGCGIVVEPENELELINAMKKAVEWQKEILEEKGQKGFDYGILHFSKKENLQKVITIIQN